MKWMLAVVTCIGSMFLGSVGTASAEGGSCPPGYYPIGGQGVQGCAPIPGGASGGASQSEVPANSPTGRWIKTWGSISESTTSDDAGVSDGKRTKAEAEAAAIARCASAGAKNCKITMSYYNQCVSWLIPRWRSGQGASGIGGGPTPEDARFSAQAHCKNDGPGPCEEIYANCTKPIFEEF
ncbi:MULTISPECIES: DUF4189 domain-containing protein [Stenotrophomonas]|uniref:DUF4189 domain-containing protein n=1 Tax=Stenotrophomonas TaxID=40323 RepID=UPI000D53DB05|nr:MULTISPECIES: DUF4189 domain-containing protein [Stenotrophomonas]AWH31253.1 hypothetical protein C1931_11755 [Stenotrophomonas sp. YAU14A_MKIMI4_1]